MKLFSLEITIERPERTVTGYGGESIQDTFTGMFAFFDQVRCIFFGLFTGVWC